MFRLLQATILGRVAYYWKVRGWTVCWLVNGSGPNVPDRSSSFETERSHWSHVSSWWVFLECAKKILSHFYVGTGILFHQAVRSLIEGRFVLWSIYKNVIKVVGAEYA